MSVAADTVVVVAVAAAAAGAIVWPMLLTFGDSH